MLAQPVLECGARQAGRAQPTGAVIYGRSDATIYRQGIRMGTAELYRAVEGFEEITESLVVDLEYLGRESWMALFVVLKPGQVPNEILAVPAVPRTLTGKKLEIPIKKLLLRQPLEKVLTRDALANPASLD